MRLRGAGYELLDEKETASIVDFMLDILDQVGMRIENDAMCRHLADSGALWDGEFGVRFPRRLLEEYIEEQRVPGKGEPHSGREKSFAGGIGGYPLRWRDPCDSRIKPQTLRSTADLTRLADYLPGITAIGTVGVPGDVPPLLRPFFMRLVSWRYAAGKLANTYVVWDSTLCPYIVEFCQAVSEMEAEKGGMERWFRAGNYLVSPLKYTREPAAQFEWFWKHGYSLFVGNLPSFGGTVPVTIAGGVALALAETLALSFIQHVFFGVEGLYLATVIAPLDMRSGYMPYGRPEQLLAGLAVRQVCRYLGTLDDQALATACGAKDADIECGLSKGLSAGLQLGMLDKLYWSFGLTSTDEVVDPRMMVVENEFVEGLKRLSRGFEVNRDTLGLDAVREVGPGGQFLSHPHTLEHFRGETWLPEFFSGESLNSWTAAGSVPILEKARRRALEILETHHPRGIKPETEEALFSLIDRFAQKLRIDDYARPPIPA